MTPKLYGSDRFTNREIKTVLPDRSWAGKPCFLVGGGPSLKGFDFNRLKGKRTIGVNRAFEAFDPTIIFSMDTRFLKWVESGKYGEEARMKFEKSQAYKIWLCTYRASLPSAIFIIPVYKDYNTGLRALTFSTIEGIGHGNNSGYGALNLAVCLGANPIYLLGYDMNHSNGHSHWHEGHPLKQKEHTVQNFIKFFDEAAPKIAAKKIKVINLNPKSGLNCFPKKNAEDVL